MPGLRWKLSLAWTICGGPTWPSQQFSRPLFVWHRRCGWCARSGSGVKLSVVARPQHTPWEIEHVFRR